MGVATAGYCVGNLHLEGHPLGGGGSLLDLPTLPRTPPAGGRVYNVP